MTRGEAPISARGRPTAVRGPLGQCVTTPPHHAFPEPQARLPCGSLPRSRSWVQRKGGPRQGPFDL